MSLQKRFKSRYPKANFADFKTEDFFGKPNFKTEYFFGKPNFGRAMKRQLFLMTTEKISDRVFTSQKR